MAKHSPKKRGVTRAAPTLDVSLQDGSLIQSAIPQEKLRRLIRVLIIVAAVWWIYWPVLHGDWLWDDDIDITGNSITRSASGLWSIWFEPGTQLDYYPIKASFQWVQWHLWGADTLGYHVTNILLHIVGALLVWRLLGKLGLRLAWLGGLIFAIHPTAVESVAWIAELKNTLSLPPFLLAMCFYLDYDEHHRRRDYLLALELFVVAMLCKPTMVMFPVVILLYTWWKRDRIEWKDVQASAPFFGISLVLGLVTLLVGSWYQQLHHPNAGIVPLGGFFSRLALAGLSISFYFAKTIWPMDLMPIYPQWPVNPPSFGQFLPWPILIGAMYWIWIKRREWGRHVLFGLGFFLITLAPFVTLNIEGYATFTWVMDHFLYIPILGLIGLMVAGLEEIAGRLSSTFRLGGIGILAIVLALLTWESHQYAKMFINQETLWTYEIKQNPTAWLARNNLGNTLLDRGKVNDAIEQFSEALKLNPDFPEAQMNMGVALVRAGRLSEGVSHYHEALRLNPYDGQVHYNWGNALFRTGHIPEAIAHYREALRLKPDYAEAHNNWGNALLDAGQAFDAIGHFQEALQFKPDFAEAHVNWGNALLQLRQYDEAIAQYQEALRLKPDSPEADYNWGNALFYSGRPDEAIAQYQAALLLNPDYAKARYNWGNALLQEKRPQDALVQYQQVLVIEPNNANAHNNCAVALALMGRGPEAIEQLQEALRLDPNLPGAHKNLAALQAGVAKNQKK